MRYRAGKAPLALVFSSLLVAVLACNFPSVELSPPAGEAPSQPSAAVAIAPENTPTPELVALDVCSLLSQEEAESMLGGPLEDPGVTMTGTCVYQSGNLQLSIAAAQGEEAKELILVGPIMIAFLLGEDSEEAKLLEQLKANVSNLSVEELYQQSLAIYKASTLSFQPVPELGAGVYWSWDPSGLGTLVRIDGDNYVSSVAFTPDEGSSRELAENALSIVAVRLPARFSVMTDGSIKLDMGGTPEPAETP